MESSFLHTIIKSYVTTGLLLLVILIMSMQGTANFLSILNICMIMTYGYLLYFSSQRNDEYYTTQKLGLTVFIYSLVYVALYYGLSLYYKNDIMVFCYSDASFYKNTVEKMYNASSLMKAFQYIAKWGYDDWGAPVSMLLCYSMFPSKLFLNFVYILLGTISAISLFQIGKRFMSVRYAYIAALTFGASSYWIWYHSSFLKESVMVFIVIESFYFFYKYIERANVGYLIVAMLLSLLLIFFRPAIIAFLWASWSVYFLMNSKNKIIWFFYIIIVGCVAILSVSYVQQIYDRYTHGGDIESIKTYIGVTRFSWATNMVAAMIGPFPNLVCRTSDIAYKHLYGSGLLLKYMLFVPFWYGAYYALKNRMKEIFPIFFFCVIEILMLIYIDNGLVLRKALPHVPFFIWGAIWFVSVCDDDESMISSKLINITKFSWIIVAISTVVWNIYKGTY